MHDPHATPTQKCSETDDFPPVKAPGLNQQEKEQNQMCSTDKALGSCVGEEPQKCEISSPYLTLFFLQSIQPGPEQICQVNEKHGP